MSPPMSGPYTRDPAAGAILPGISSTKHIEKTCYYGL